MTNGLLEPGTEMLFDTDDHEGRARVRVLRPGAKVGPLQMYKVQVLEVVQPSTIRSIKAGQTLEVAECAFDGSRRLIAISTE